MRKKLPPHPASSSRSSSKTSPKPSACPPYKLASKTTSSDPASQASSLRTNPETPASPSTTSPASAWAASQRKCAHILRTPQSLHPSCPYLQNSSVLVPGAPPSQVTPPTPLIPPTRAPHARDLHRAGTAPETKRDHLVAVPYPAPSPHHGVMAMRNAVPLRIPARRQQRRMEGGGPIQVHLLAHHRAGAHDRRPGHRCQNVQGGGCRLRVLRRRRQVREREELGRCQVQDLHRGVGRGGLIRHRGQGQDLRRRSGGGGKRSVKPKFDSYVVHGSVAPIKH